jgi:hypothetical protein
VPVERRPTGLGAPPPVRGSEGRRTGSCVPPRRPECESAIARPTTSASGSPAAIAAVMRFDSEWIIVWAAMKTPPATAIRRRGSPVAMEAASRRSPCSERPARRSTSVGSTVARQASETSVSKVSSIGRDSKSRLIPVVAPRNRTSGLCSRPRRSRSSSTGRSAKYGR